jgi:hypothetical protein
MNWSRLVLPSFTIAAAAAALCATTIASHAANNIGLPTIPFVINNNTGHSGRLFVYIIGVLPNEQVTCETADGPKQLNKSVYVSALNGDVTTVPRADTPVSFALDLGVTDRVRIKLPQLTAARIFFSLKQPVVVTNPNNAGCPPSSPPGWVGADPNYPRLFDFAEFTWTAHDNTMGGNATQVDMFGFAMLIAMKGKDDGGNPVVRKAGFSDPAARQNIFAALQNAGRPWNKLIIGNLRIVAPYHGMDLGRFPHNQLDQYISGVWAKYKTQSLFARAEGIEYNGTVQGGDLVFQQIGGPESFKFDKPTSYHAYQNFMPAILGPSGNAARAGVVGAMLSASFMRTMLFLNRNLIDERASCKVGKFYTDAPVNMYAKTFHENALRGLAYSFGFDDTCQQSSFIQVHEPENLTITLQPL